MAEDAEKMKFIEKNKISLDRLILLNKVSEEEIMRQMRIRDRTLIDQFDIPVQADDFDDIREEYTQMLKKQSAKGNNGIIKSRCV